MTRYVFAVVWLPLLTLCAIGFVSYQRAAVTSRLHEAVHEGDLPKLKDLLAAGHDVDQRNRGDALGVRIRRYPLPYENNVTPLYVAVADTKPEIVEFLLERGANPNHGGGYDTALHRAFVNLSPPFNIHGYDLSNEPPFDLDASLEVIRLLISHEADIHFRRHPGDSYFLTPLETVQQMKDDELRTTIFGWMCDASQTENRTQESP